ncbi:hypothetical protein SAMN04489732_1471 [Amycolatopsis saalfeldensis]|uniref:Uncharacterized protein n=1 Tax=Amycolatopsis saalfeldensis TaxID=394193 RepID=A0A1H8YQD3_9PSEU|nr:hypothetical protein SAMN04489732_1471 [Amycolatopsis saalfeldensis]
MKTSTITPDAHAPGIHITDRAETTEAVTA